MRAPCNGSAGGTYRGGLALRYDPVLITVVTVVALLSADPVATTEVPPVQADPQYARKPGAGCRATLFPEGNPLRLGVSSVQVVSTEAVPTDPPVRHPAYEIKSDRFIPEYEFRATEYRHKSGMSVWSITTPPSETEKVFRICFRTPVLDSYGTPHVLQHAVLSGSEKYPLYSIYEKLMDLGLSTYLNASTWPDRTCYEFTSVNVKDFYNLAGVYLDAVFRPLAVRDTWHLRQKGWRFELVPRKQANAADDATDVDCAATPEVCDLTYAGGVLSEMKGFWANPDAAEEMHRLKELFPQVETYVEASGGIPSAIPGLTFEHLKAFHERHYSPSNAWITFFGPDDVETRLNFVDNYLSTHPPNREQPEVAIGTQTAFSEPKYAEYPYTSASKELMDYVTVSWVLNPCHASDVCEVFGADIRVGLRILNHLLVGTKASPLYKALAESDLGSAVLSHGIDFDLKHAIYTVGLKYVAQREGAAAEVEAVVLETLAALTNAGFPPNEVAAAFNAVEFALREFPRTELPRGVKLSRRMDEQIAYRRDPLEALTFDKPLRRLRERVAKGEKVFEEMLKQYLLENPHRLTLRLKASKTLADELAAVERETLAGIKAALGPEELAAIAREQQALKLMQVTPPSPEALATLPKLAREDISPEGEEVPLAVASLMKVPLVTHELPSSGLVYITIGLSLADLSLEDVDYLPLFTGMMVQAGTSELPPEVLIPLVGQATGKLSATFTFRPAPAKPFTIPDPYAARGLVYLSAKATNARAVDTWCLLHSLLVDTNFANRKVGLQIIKKIIADRKDIFTHLAFYEARRLALSSFNVASLMEERTEGHKSLVFYRQLLEQAEGDWKDVEARLCAIRERLLRRANLVLNITGDAPSLSAATEGPGGARLLELINALPDSGPNRSNFMPKGLGAEALDREPLWARDVRELQLLAPGTRVAYITPTQVSDIALVTPFAPPGSAVLGSDAVAMSRVDSIYLMTQVREIGGAYGVWLRGGRNGLLSFMSYRDPNAVRTLRTFRASPAFAESWANEADEEAILQALLPVISGLDQPEGVYDKGLASLWHFIERETPEDRHAYRTQVLHTTQRQLQHFARHLREALEAKVESVVLLGPASAVKEVTERQKRS